MALQSFKIIGAKCEKEAQNLPQNLSHSVALSSSEEEPRLHVCMATANR